MKRVLASAFGLALLFYAGCDSGEQTCTNCGMTRTDEQCTEIAVANGCESGVAFTDPESTCDTPSTGCRFIGCSDDRAIFCDLPERDAGM